MKAIMGKKLGMTQIFAEDGRLISVTVIEAGPMVVTQIKTKENEDRKSTRLNSSHSMISYAVFCLKKKTNINHLT